MPSSGGGTGTPISGGGSPGAITSVDGFPVTWLSLYRYAKMVGINPVHFFGGVGTGVWPLNDNACSDIWPKYPWQHGSQLSLWELAHAIKDAENSIANYVGYPLAPTFVASEQHRYPEFHNKDFRSIGSRGLGDRHRSVPAAWRKVISPGRRGLTLIEAGVTVDYSDEDGDGFSETATITVATTVTPCEVKAYFAGKSGAPEWEVRDANSKTASGSNVVLKFDSWLFLNPDKQNAAPTDEGYSAIDVTSTANYVDTVDIYREYVDTTAVAAQFAWLCDSCGTANCTVCGPTNQDGCLVIRNSETGHVVPSPATYDSGWTIATWTKGVSPEYVNIWYQAGDRSQEYLSGRTCDPLSDFWAWQIILLATARLYKPFCQCGNITVWAKNLQVDLTRQGTEGGHLFDFTSIANPFGTLRGEFMVYKNLALGGGKRKISTGTLR